VYSLDAEAGAVLPFQKKEKTIIQFQSTNRLHNAEELYGRSILVIYDSTLLILELQ
jgi:hypothetical protein